ncbi:MAG: 16S rRNA (cytosine(1402)-N(4))-methyltransferase RsmH [Acidobacteria bacterium]|nr:16S rRNA (cytosine(1402)-N(4))-methyltransferase RsmH [Acidobacteriota bacterium]
MEHQDDFMAGHTADRRDTNGAFHHTPVMAAEVLDALRGIPAGIVIDATLGGGGHSDLLLEELDHIEIVGFDQDGDAIAAARKRLQPYGTRSVALHRRFDELPEVAAERSIASISGFLFDLGVSSPQLDRAERGFSYSQDGQLDMRMDRSRPRDASNIVNESSESSLRDILREYGDERHAGRIARAIVEARPIHGSAELAQLVYDAVPAATRAGRHPARRTFQALRIAVNDEISVLRSGLDGALDLLDSGGRGVVISYHSGEDRVVKAAFSPLVDDKRDTTPDVVEPPQADYVLLWRGSRRPGDDEIERNPRARSARMRGIERSVAA